MAGNTDTFGDNSSTDVEGGRANDITAVYIEMFINTKCFSLKVETNRLLYLIFNILFCTQLVAGICELTGWLITEISIIHTPGRQYQDILI